MSSSSSNGVGIPIAEAELTYALARELPRVLRPGKGRVLVVLDEVELGVGRPDLIAVMTSPSALRARAKKGLRLNNLTEARVLGELREGSSSGVTQAHAREVGRRLKARGWLESSASTGPVVSDSWLIEAKMQDWQAGLMQLSRGRWACNRAALLLPESVVPRVPTARLNRLALGLISYGNGGRVRWHRRGRRREISLTADVWLAELAIRHLYTPAEPVK